MSQLIIEYDFNGGWKHKYNHVAPKKYVCVKVPRFLQGRDKVVGVIIDNRDEWRKRLDTITSKATYDILNVEAKEKEQG